MMYDEPQPDADGDCWDPAHDDACTCGADPDRVYEQGVER